MDVQETIAKAQDAVEEDGELSGMLVEALHEVLESLDRNGVAHRVLFLDADEETLVTRYKETRRRHPLAPGARTGWVNAGRRRRAPDRAQRAGRRGQKKAAVLLRPAPCPLRPKKRPTRTACSTERRPPRGTPSSAS